MIKIKKDKQQPWQLVVKSQTATRKFQAQVELVNTQRKKSTIAELIERLKTLPQGAKFYAGGDDDNDVILYVYNVETRPLTPKELVKAKRLAKQDAERIAKLEEQRLSNIDLYQQLRKRTLDAARENAKSPNPSDHNCSVIPNIELDPCQVCT